MTRQFWVLLVGCLFAGLLVAASASAASSRPAPSPELTWRGGQTSTDALWSCSRSADDHARHADGSRCPDDDHGPCDEGCACHCCHGHGAAAVWHPLSAFIGVVPRVTAVAAAGPLRGLVPNPYLDRIFRPPRP